MTIEANVSEQDDIDNATALSHALAILTLITGDEWTKQKLLDTNLALKSEASKALASQGYTASDASTVVEERWAEYESHEPIAPPTPQQGFRSAVVGESAPVAEDTSWKQPAGLPSREDLKARAADRIAQWKADKQAAQAAQEEAAPPVEDAASGEQI